MLQLIKNLVPKSLKNLVRKNRVENKPIYKSAYELRNKSILTDEDRKFWQENGFVVLKNMFSNQSIDQAVQLIDDLWDKRKDPSNPLVVDIFIETDKGKRIYFRDAPDDARQEPYKLNDVFLESKLVQEMVLQTNLAAVVAELLEGDPTVCNSLTFERSSQQNFHFDTFYMPPPIENKMVASWIALEDVSPEAGPLVYYPGSHKIPSYKFSHGKLHAVSSEMPDWEKFIEKELKDRGLQQSTFLAKKGDVLIWHSQLLHAGQAITNKNLTRKSLVTHYFRAQDFPVGSCEKIGPGKYFMKRSHQQVQ